jgi:hypothetical protein
MLRFSDDMEMPTELAIVDAAVKDVVDMEALGYIIRVAMVARGISNQRARFKKSIEREQGKRASGYSIRSPHGFCFR